jgi:hypothetical protein
MAGRAVLQIMLWFSCPVVYVKSGSNLIHGSTNGEMLVNFLMEVLDACYNEGAEVGATVCDMDANNIKALKQLCVAKMHLSSGFRIKKLQL